MSKCKYCQKAFDWGRSDDGWVPLVPVSEHEGLDRTYQDEDGELRAHHHLVCVDRGGPSVRITKLPRKVRGSEVSTVKEPGPEPEPDKRKARLGEDLAPGAFSLFRRRKPKTT